jgi:quercetin dioxygenase-like cupin family protein
MTDTPRFTVIPPAQHHVFWVGGQRQAVILGAPETNGRYALSHSTIAVGGGALEHSHSREAEAFYVIEGTLRFSLEGETVTLEKGSLLHCEPGLKYSFEALTPTEVLILYAPAGLERFIAESGLPDTPGAYQRSVDGAGAVLAAAPAYGVNYTAMQKSGD